MAQLRFSTLVIAAGLALAAPTTAAQAGTLMHETTGTSELVSVKASGRVPQQLDSEWSAISADGRYIAFQSEAHGLVPGVGRTRHHTHVYLRDRVTGVTSVVDATPDGQLSNGDAPLYGEPMTLSVADGGRLVAFTSTATDLVAEPTRKGTYNVYLRDTLTGTTTLVSRGFDGAATDALSWSPVISADGSTLVFTSAARNLVPHGAGGHVGAIYRYDVGSREISLVSMTPAGDFANDLSQHAYLSADGQLISYETWATDIVPMTGEFTVDAVLYDVAADTTTLLGRPASGEAPDGQSNGAVVTDDGSAVFFTSWASNVVEDDGNGNISDIFRYDVRSHAVTLLTHSPTGGSTRANSQQASPTADGALVAFLSYAPNLIRHDQNRSVGDIFVLDVGTGAVTPVSTTRSGRTANNHSLNPVISADGSTVSYDSFATNLVRHTRTTITRTYATPVP